jgi:predicted nucleotidyltransferase
LAKNKDSDLLNNIIETLKEKLNPTRLFLFGSRANGRARPDSDYDFVVVVPKMKGNRVDNMIRASKFLSHINARVEVFVYSEKEFDEWKDELSSIPETALNTGKEIELG